MKNSQAKKPSLSAKKSNKPNTSKKKPKNQGTVKQRVSRKKAQVLQLLRENLAIVTTSCQKANIATVTFYDWIKKDKVFAAEFEAIKDEIIPQVEDRLMKHIVENNLKAITFYLRSISPRYKPKMGIDLGNQGDRGFKLNISVVGDENSNEGNILATNEKTE